MARHSCYLETQPCWLYYPSEHGFLIVCTTCEHFITSYGNNRAGYPAYILYRFLLPVLECSGRKLYTHRIIVMDLLIFCYGITLASDRITSAIVSYIKSQISPMD